MPSPAPGPKMETVLKDQAGPQGGWSQWDLPADPPEGGVIVPGLCPPHRGGAVSAATGGAGPPRRVCRCQVAGPLPSPSWGWFPQGAVLRERVYWGLTLDWISLPNWIFRFSVQWLPEPG